MFKKYADKAKKEFMSHIEPAVVDRTRSEIPISLKEYKGVRLNSYEQKYIEPFLSDEAFIFKLEEVISNCFIEMSQYKVWSTYNDYVQSDGINELLKRFKERIK